MNELKGQNIEKDEYIKKIHKSKRRKKAYEYNN